MTHWAWGRETGWKVWQEQRDNLAGRWGNREEGEPSSRWEAFGADFWVRVRGRMMHSGKNGQNRVGLAAYSDIQIHLECNLFWKKLLLIYSHSSLTPFLLVSKHFFFFFFTVLGIICQVKVLTVVVECQYLYLPLLRTFSPKCWDLSCQVKMLTNHTLLNINLKKKPVWYLSVTMSILHCLINEIKMLRNAQLLTFRYLHSKTKRNVVVVLLQHLTTKHSVSFWPEG